MSNDKELIRYIIRRVESIDQKVDTILQFKWKIIGGSVALSMILTVAIQVAALIIKGG